MRHETKVDRLQVKDPFTGPKTYAYRAVCSCGWRGHTIFVELYGREGAEARAFEDMSLHGSES